MSFLDKTIRLIVAIGALCAGCYYQNAWGLLGFIPLLTGYFGYCPLYLLIKKGVKWAGKQE